MQITKRRLKELIKEEMEHLSKTGDLNSVTESEKMAFETILEKLTPKQLQEMGLKRVMVESEEGTSGLGVDLDRETASPKVKKMKKEVARLKRLKANGAKYDSKKLKDLEKQLERYKQNPGISS